VGEGKWKDGRLDGVVEYWRDGMMEKWVGKASSKFLHIDFEDLSIYHF